MCVIDGRVHQDVRSLQLEGCVWAEDHGVNRGQLANRHTRRMDCLSAAYLCPANIRPPVACHERNQAWGCDVQEIGSLRASLSIR